MKSFSITDIGKERTVNQDYIYCEDKSIGNLPNLFIVADGMGGHNAGDFASRYCVDTITSHIIKCKRKTPIGILEEAIKTANEKLLLKAEEQKELDGMGTTLVVATIFNDTMYIANIGDSRLYIIDDDIKQITEDHSLVEEMIKTGELPRKEARFHPNKNVITRALGSGKSVSPDYFEVSLKSGDTVLMCSDGLSNMIDDEEIKTIVKEYGEIKLVGRKLIEKANEYGGKDNIAIILIRK